MKDAHRVIVVMESTKRPNPYEVWVLIALFISSFTALINVTPTPNSIRQLLPGPSVFIWNLQIAIGTFLALLGMWLMRTRFRLPIFSNQPAVARLIKIVGHIWTGSGALIYSWVIFYYIGQQATMAGLTVGSIAVAAAFRALQLRGQVRHMLQKVGEQDDRNIRGTLVDGGE